MTHQHISDSIIQFFCNSC